MRKYLIISSIIVILGSIIFIIMYLIFPVISNKKLISSYSASAMEKILITNYQYCEVPYTYFINFCSMQECSSKCDSTKEDCEKKCENARYNCAKAFNDLSAVQLKELYELKNKSAQNSGWFDYNNDGFETKTAWVNKEGSILIYKNKPVTEDNFNKFDTNNDGVIPKIIHIAIWGF